MWVILILSALLTTLGQAGPWGRALGPKVAEKAGPWGLSLGSCHVLRARDGEDNASKWDVVGCSAGFYF